MKPHIFHPDAGEEYVRAVEYYAAIAPELGSRFHNEIERLIREVRHQPDRFFRFSPPAQRTLARKFPYSLVYLDEPDRIWIVAVMHMKRRPGYWRERSVENALAETTRRSPIAIWFVCSSKFQFN